MLENSTQKLQMKFAPNTIEHLGVKMYSTLPPVVSELIANSYDADAKEVKILLNDSENKEIVVSDDGHGMSFDEINESFLTIGRNRRVKNSTDESPKGRKVIGKKGLGKLSFFGIAHEIEIITIKDNKKNSFVMDWEAIMRMENEEGGIENYEPGILILDEDTDEDNGTIVTLRKIQRVSNFDVETLADSISKYFILPDDFNIKLSHNDNEWIEIDNTRRYASTPAEVEWTVPKDVEFGDDCEHFKNITGHLLATEKPISPNTNMRGVTLFSRKKLVNLPEYFSDSTSSHFFNYLTGWLEVDFIDELDEDVIGTNRQTLNWDHPEMQKLRLCLQNLLKWIERDWRVKRKSIRETKLDDELKKVDITIGEWQENVPDKIKLDLIPVLEKIVGDSELSNEEITGAVKHLKNVLPPYTYYHYQNLHSNLSDAVFQYYADQNYYEAVRMGTIRYITLLRAKISKQDGNEEQVIVHAFKEQGAVLSVVKKYSSYKNVNTGAEITDITKETISRGHRLLAQAMIASFRNPVSHQEPHDLKMSEIYTEQDCLDALGLLSHLFRRLDNTESV
ncbi:MAG: ATP-binding protein [Patescibacteria group bacterium]|nr:MAG: ATP-binding protein [Patescibacteria group bacterium]